MTFAVTRDVPVAFTAVLLAFAPCWVWIAGYRLGKRKSALEAEACRYVEGLRAAQDSGAVLPELSPQLRRLLGSDS